MAFKGHVWIKGPVSCHVICWCLDDFQSMAYGTIGLRGTHVMCHVGEDIRVAQGHAMGPTSTERTVAEMELNGALATRSLVQVCLNFIAFELL